MHGELSIGGHLINVPTSVAEMPQRGPQGWRAWARDNIPDEAIRNWNRNKDQKVLNE